MFKKQKLHSLSNNNKSQDYNAKKFESKSNYSSYSSYIVYNKIDNANISSMFIDKYKDRLKYGKSQIELSENDKIDTTKNLRKSQFTAMEHKLMSIYKVDETVLRQKKLRTDFNFIHK